MHYFQSLFLLIIFVSFVGCSNNRAASVEKTSTVPAPAATQQATATQLSTPVQTNTPTLQPKSTATPITTKTPTATATLITKRWQKPQTDNYAKDMAYSLGQPSAESLLQIYYGLAKHETTSDSSGIISEYQTVDNLHKLLAHELSLYDTIQLTDTLSLVQAFGDYDLYLSHEDVARYIREAALITALNQSSYDLSVHARRSAYGIYFTPTPLDLNHDGIIDWIIKAEIRDLSISETFFVPVFYDSQTNRYDVLPHSIDYFGIERRYTFHYDADFTGDQKPDLLIKEKGLDQHDSLHLATWQDGQLKPLSFSSDYAWVTSIERIDRDDYEIADFDDDGVMEIQRMQFSEGVNLSYAYCGQSMIQYDWKGVDVITTITSDYDHDQDPSCLATEVLFQEPQPLPDRELLEHIDKLLTPTDWKEYGTWYALVEVDLAAQQWLDGDYAGANSTMNGIWQYADEGVEDDYITHLQIMWQASNDDFFTFCRTLYHDFWASPSPWAGYSDRVYHLGGRFNENLGKVPLPEFFCPAETLTQAKIDLLTEQFVSTPISTFEQANIPVSFEQQINLDADPELEWLAIVDAGRYQLGYWDLVDSNWYYQHLDNLSHYGISDPDIQQVEVELRDVTADGVDDLLVLRLEIDRDIEYVQPDLTMLLVYDLEAQQYIVEAPVNGFTDVNVSSIADISKDTVDKLVAKQNEYIGLGFANDEAHLVVAGEETIFYLALHQFIQHTIKKEHPAVLRRDMLEALEQVPQDRVNADLVKYELWYLLGQSYELEGNSAEALTYYRQLIETAPDSYWSWLAFARMIPTQ